MTVARVVDLTRPLAMRPTVLRRRTGVLVFVLWFGAMAAWSLATPVWASPDEYSHAFRAYSVAHGHVYASPVPAVRGTGGFVTVPRGWLNSAQHAKCNIGRDRDANCIPPLTNDARPVQVASSAARYNPLYYLVVGSVTLVSSPAHALRLMRLASAALSAFFLTWAFTGALTARRPVLAASTVLMAATPMVLFLGSAINPNGLEITAAMCAWVCGFQATMNPDPAVARTLLRRTGIALIAVVETRAISPLWVVLILAALGAAVANRKLLSRYRDTLVRWAFGVAAATLLAGIWTVVSKAGQLQTSAVRKQTLAATWQHAWDGGFYQLFWFRGTVGNFGWLDTPLAPNVTDVWLFVAAGLLLLALLVGSPRERLVLAALVAVTVLLPTWISAMDFNRYGVFWQARYTMPISLGVVLLSGTTIARSKRLAWSQETARVAGALPAAVAVIIDLVGFVVALSRYSVGATKPLSIFGPWQPPLGGLAVTVIEAMCVVGLAFCAANCHWASAISAGSAGRPSATEPGAGRDASQPEAALNVTGTKGFTHVASAALWVGGLPRSVWRETGLS